jgi:hypothetical protein
MNYGFYRVKMSEYEEVFIPIPTSNKLFSSVYNLQDLARQQVKTELRTLRS